MMRNWDTPKHAKHLGKKLGKVEHLAQGVHLMNRETANSDFRILQGGPLCCRQNQVPVGLPKEKRAGKKGKPPVQF